MATSTTALTAAQAVQFIQSRVQVTEPGKYALQVISANPFEDRVILGLKAQASDKLEVAKQHLREGDYNAAANTNMSTSVFSNSGFIPAKGEHISCMVDYVENREGKMVLGVVSISEIKARSTKKVNLGDEFANLLDTENTESDEPQLD